MKGQKLNKENGSPKRLYNEAFKQMVVKEYERGFLNKDQLQAKYGISGHSTLLYWCRKYGKLLYPKKGESTGRPMKDPQKQRIKQLEKQLEDARLKILAYEKLIEITEKQEDIIILKKDVAKQLESLPKNTREK